MLDDRTMHRYQIDKSHTRQVSQNHRENYQNFTNSDIFFILVVAKVAFFVRSPVQCTVYSVNVQCTTATKHINRDTKR